MKGKALIGELRYFKDKKCALENLPDELKLLDLMRKSYFNNKKKIRYIESLQRQMESDYKKTIEDVSDIEDRLLCLTDKEKLVVTEMYIEDMEDAVSRLMSELQCGRSQVYRIKDSALNKMLD